MHSRCRASPKAQTAHPSRGTPQRESNQALLVLVAGETVKGGVVAGVSAGHIRDVALSEAYSVDRCPPRVVVFGPMRECKGGWPLRAYVGHLGGA